MDRYDYGWDRFFEESFQAYQDQGLIAGRVFLEHKHLYRLYTECGELLGEVSGKFRHTVQGNHDYPAVGDWVVLNVLPGGDRAVIQGVLPRKSKLSRKIAWHETQEQILAVNLDMAFIVSSLNRDFNLRRLERYLILVWESGANPVIILSKADLCDDLPTKIEQVEAVAFGIPAHAISVYNRTGLSELNGYFAKGKTIAIIGSSGVGKTTLINYLANKKILEVNSVREDDDRGRHTTTHRQLVCLSSGGLIIDTPGMKELTLWGDGGSLQGAFEDIETMAKECRFRDCQHHQEPGCAVKKAILTGVLNPDRLINYHKLRKELRYLESRQDNLARLQEKQKAKGIAKAIKSINEKKQKGE